jgi:Tfp pilus assembly protein PilX
MKIRFTIQNQTGSALLLVMIMSAIALAILAGVMTWAATSNKLTHRSIQYTRSVAAAEAATEKVESQMTRDFLNGGELTVSNNLNSYRQTVPTTSDSSYWNTWVFDDGNGNANQTYVQLTSTTNTIALDAPYTGLKGYGSTYTTASHASDTASPQDVNAGVVQQLQLVRIPVFQFAMFSSGNMEISCGHPFDITGHVHCNGILYIEPDSSLTFESGVTAVLNVLDQRDSADGDTRGAPAGIPNQLFFVDTNSPTFPVNALTLPIGTTNTPEAIREIIEPPPAAGDTNAALAALRYYNICDLRLTVSDNGVVATAGTLVHLMRPITTNELALFVSTTSSFIDDREGKTVLPIDINIGNLTTWIGTNTSLPNLSSLYVVDNRTIPAGSLGAVRVYNGTNLPPNGLTVATGLPLYVWGDYNDDPSRLGTSDTSLTHPASLVADAITFLSDAWKDGTTGPGITPPNAVNTTINAALLTGVVETAPPPSPSLNGYSGGMENFPRFLETWGSANATNTYNGSMVKMFPSLYATGVWGQKFVYEPPFRNWAYDSNFDDPTKLPPKTPSFLQVKRHQWATVPAGTNTVAATP